MDTMDEIALEKVISKKTFNLCFCTKIRFVNVEHVTPFYLTF